MARKLKTQTHPATVSDVESHIETLRDELGEEMRSWYDNMSENLQGGDKGCSVDEAASTLEGLDTPDIPEFFSDLGFTYTTSHKGGRKGDPRWLRRDNETSALSAAVEAVRDRVQQLRDGLAELELPEDAEDDTEVTIGEETFTLGEVNTAIEEGEQFADDLENVQGEADSVEFPGMYG